MTRIILIATAFSLAGALPAAAQRLDPAPAGGAAEAQLIEEIVAWVNDDVVLLSDLVQAERQAMEELRQSQRDGVQRTQQAQQIREQMLLQMIWNRLLIQEAERLYDIEQIKEEVVLRFMKTQQVTTEAELEQILQQYRMTRDELEDRLLMSTAPDLVIDSQVMRTIGVTEQEARAYYEENKAQFATPAEVIFREIVLEAEDPNVRVSRRAEAQAIVDEARSGGDFAELVEQHSEAPSKAIGGKIGPIDPGDLITEIGEAVQDVPVGEVSDPIETPRGWHILLVEQRTDSVVPPFEEVRAECETACRRERFGPLYEEFLSDLWADATVEVRDRYAGRLPEPWRERTEIRD